MNNFKFVEKDYLIILLSIIGMFIGLTFFYACGSDKSGLEERTSVEAEEAIEVEAKQDLSENSDEPVANLPNSLKNCVVYSETFIHPFTGEELKREVVGMTEEGLCKYREEMPNGGEMSCMYTKETRTVIAQYYVDMMRMGPGNFSSGAKTYSIEGKTVMNPLDEVMNNGTCTITGY